MISIYTHHANRIATSSCAITQHQLEGLTLLLRDGLCGWSSPRKSTQWKQSPFHPRFTVVTDARLGGNWWNAAFRAPKVEGFSEVQNICWVLLSCSLSHWVSWYCHGFQLFGTFLRKKIARRQEFGEVGSRTGSSICSFPQRTHCLTSDTDMEKIHAHVQFNERKT